MGLINWIFDFYQHHRIDQVQQQATEARLAALSVRGSGGDLDAARLERAVGELALAVKTLQRIVTEKGLCTQDELRTRLLAVDLEDGRADGRAPLST